MAAVIDALDPSWINKPLPEGDGPLYDSEDLRRLQGFQLAAGATPGSSRTGVLNPRDLTLSLSGSSVRVGPGGCVIGTGKGAYVAGLPAVTTIGALLPADVTNPRRDRVVLEILDPDNGGGPGRKAQLRVIDGTPNASAATGGGFPPAPSSPFIDLGYVDVPKVGAGSPAVTARPAITAAAGAPIPVWSESDRNLLPKWEGLRALRLDQEGAIDTCTGGAWWGPTRAYGAVSPTGYEVTGNAIVEFKGSRKLVVVDIQIKRTGEPISIGTAWSGFGQVLPTVVLGNSLLKYAAVWISGAGANNSAVGVSLNPVDGLMSIRGAAPFTWAKNALFTVNMVYYV